ncbi:MAG: RagB/SusD family nutrient uptake outer membrane protein, partial [Alistipes sp.]|nr:RagB/SusD family nutrient uptake outer membrane protein [Alistipes sp.]
RVEEMYLIEAEATAHYDEGTGKSLLEAFMAHRNPKYSAAGVTNLIDEIIFQKRVELWGEGIVFYDFKRLNMGIQNGYAGTNVPTDSRVNVEGRAPWWNFCIPESELLQNPALEGFNNPNPDGMVQLWK